MDEEYYKAIQAVHDIDETIIDLMDQLIHIVESFHCAPVTQSLIDLLEAMSRFAEQLVIMHIQRLMQ
jgi:hypothetical protein